MPGNNNFYNTALELLRSKEFTANKSIVIPAGGKEVSFTFTSNKTKPATTVYLRCWTWHLHPVTVKKSLMLDGMLVKMAKGGPMKFSHDAVDDTC